MARQRVREMKRQALSSRLLLDMLLLLVVALLCGDLLSAPSAFIVPPSQPTLGRASPSLTGLSFGQRDAGQSHKGFTTAHAEAASSLVSSLQALSFGSLWAKTGLGPLLLGVWAKVALIPPFSWVNWILGQIAKAPKFYRWYLYYTFGNMFAKWLVPGLHAQIVTGTWLGLLKTIRPGAYKEQVAMRLKELLTKQAALKSPGQQGLMAAPRLSKEAMDAVTVRVKEDSALADALGSTMVLGVWHKLERNSLDSPEISKLAPAGSQLAWVVERLRGNFASELGSFAVLEAASTASQKVKRLSDAVDTAAFNARIGVLKAADGEILVDVEQAVSEANAALQKLNNAKEEAARQSGEAGIDREAWHSKLASLQNTYASSPVLAAELAKLSEAGV